MSASSPPERPRRRTSRRSPSRTRSGPTGARLGSPTLEESVHDKLKELDEREGELELREAQLEADVQIRGDKLDEREESLAELEERLAKQERELAAYVANAQTEIQRRESEWWQKQLGAEEEISAA